MAEQQKAEQNQTLALDRWDMVDVVTERIQQMQGEGQIRFPANYSPENALKAAWLTLQSVEDKNHDPALQVCTRDSIANSLLDMVVQGLNPVKKQCYFIVHGQTLTCRRSYFGSMAIVQNYAIEDANIWFGVVYADDQFEYEIRRGLKIPTAHTQKLENVKMDAISAAYCVIEDAKGNVVNSEIMTLDQIKTSWKKSPMYKEGGNSFHNEQPDQACLRTVINRTCKSVINSSDDSYLAEAVNRSDEMAAVAPTGSEAEQYANGPIIDVTPTHVAEPEPEPEPEEPPAQPEPEPVGATAAGPAF